MKKFALWFVVLILCMPLSIAAAAPAQPAKAVKTEEIGIFINGEYIVSAVKALKIGSKNYVPVKVISSLPNIKVQVENGRTVITGTKDSIVIEKNKATFGSTKQAVATEVVGNYTYIGIGDLGKIHELGVKVLANSGTVLLWTDATGKQNSNRIINGVYHTKETRLKEGIGKKIYFYGSSKSNNYGWLVNIDADKYGTYSITYLLKNGKLIEDSYFNYTELLTTPEHDLLQSYVGKTLWAYRNTTILNGSPLKNIEKLKVVSIVLNSDNATGMTMKFKRVDGSTVNQRIPLDPSERADYYIDGSFFTEDPHVTFKASKKVWQSIYKRSVMEGMTKEQAALAWGMPEDVNVYGELEQWVYDVGQYLYFRNNLLYTWQNY